MKTRIIVAVTIIGFVLGLGWYVTAQDTSLGLNFAPGDVLTAADMNAIVTQVDVNTAVLSGLTLSDPAFRFVTTLSREQEIPAPAGGGLTGGDMTLQFDAGFTTVDITLTLTGNSANATRVHLHCNEAGVTGPIAFGIVDPGPCDAGQLAAGNLTCTLTNADFTGSDCIPTIGSPVNNIAALYFAARDGEIYANIHTADNSPGEIRGQLLGPLP